MRMYDYMVIRLYGYAFFRISDRKIMKYISILQKINMKKFVSKQINLYFCSRKGFILLRTPFSSASQDPLIVSNRHNK